MSIDVKTLALARAMGGGSGGGGNFFNENGLIKQEALPEGYPYKGLKEKVMGGRYSDTDSGVILYTEEGETHVPWASAVKVTFEEDYFFRIGDALPYDTLKVAVFGPQYNDYGEEVETPIGPMLDLLEADGFVTADYVCGFSFVVTYKDNIRVLGTLFSKAGTYLPISFLHFIKWSEESVLPIDPIYLGLTSPDGTVWGLSVSDDGTLTAVPRK